MPVWKTVSIREELTKEIEKALETGRYRSISEFVSEAIRLRLEDLLRAQGISPAQQKELLATPELMLYTSKHTWAKITPEGNIRVGLSEYAGKHLKGVVQVQAEEAGREVAKMDVLGVVETWMFMFDLYSPISGKIVKVNDDIRTKPNIVNEDPYDKGWIVEIRPKNTKVLEEELRGLLAAREYNKWITKLEGRLRD